MRVTATKRTIKQNHSNRTRTRGDNKTGYGQFKNATKHGTSNFQARALTTGDVGTRWQQAGRDRQRERESDRGRAIEREGERENDRERESDREGERQRERERARERERERERPRESD